MDTNELLHQIEATSHLQKKLMVAKRERLRGREKLAG